MSGIAGIINLDGRLHDNTLALRRMSLQMEDRGPDREGFMLADIINKKTTPYIGDSAKYPGCAELPYISEEKLSPKTFSLGIVYRGLDLEDSSVESHQPMSDKEGKIWLSFDGRIYNVVEIRESLSRLGYRFFTESDAEVFIYSYQEWGMDCLQKFNGMFAAVLYDVERNKVFFIRDRIGIKQLYYTVERGRLIFASDIKTIRASKLYRSKIHLEGLWHALSYSIAPRPMTCFENLFSFEQGCYTVYDYNSQELKTVRYWHIPIGSKDIEVSETEAIDLLEEKIFKSLEYQIPKNLKIGGFMSGGVDSTLLASMSKRYRDDFKAYTIAFDSEYSSFDETKEAKNAAEKYGISQTIYRPTIEEIRQAARETVLCAEEPYFLIDPTYILSKVAREEGVKVLFSGLGPDELFGGYGWYFKKELSLSIGERYSASHMQISDEQKKLLFGKTVSYDTGKILEKMYGKPSKSFKDDVEELNYYDLIFYIGSHHMYRNDQFIGRHSIEGRFPFLDHELIEFAFKIPSSMKIRYGNVGKYIFKALAARHIPLGSILMPKIGFGTPTIGWFENELKDLAEEKIDSLISREIFSNSEAALDIIRKKSVRMVLLEMWIEEFID